MVDLPGRRLDLTGDLRWLPQSLNTSLRQHRNVRRRTREHRDLAWLVCEAAARAGLVHATGRRVVLCVRQAPRQLDPDNLTGAFKPLVDELVRGGLLAGDDTEASGNLVLYRQERAPEAQSGCVVHVAERTGSCTASAWARRIFEAEAELDVEPLPARPKGAPRPKRQTEEQGDLGDQTTATRW